jgi:hypothetical protein
MNEILRRAVESDRIVTHGTPCDFPAWENKVAAMLSDPDQFAYLWDEVVDEVDDVDTIRREINRWYDAHPNVPRL